MKLSQREKVILIVLAVFVVSIAFYLFLLEPQFKELARINEEKAQTEALYQAFKAKMDPQNYIYTEFTVMDNTVKDASAQYYPSLLQEKLITSLEEYFDEAGIEPSAIIFDENSEVVAAIENPDAKLAKVSLLQNLKNQYLGNTPAVPAADTVAPPPPAPEAAEPAPTAEGATPAPVAPAQSTSPLESLERLGASVTFSSSYEGLAKFVKALEGDKRRIVVDKITTVRTEGSQITSKLELSFYAVPKLHEQDNDYLEWTLGNSYGTDDPYQPYKGFTKPAVDSSTPAAAKQATADFFMMVNPIASDISTVVISKKGDKTSSTYVYADNPGIENVEIELTQEGDTYYYHYRTGKSSYPKNYAEKVAFKPNGSSILLELYSSHRANKSDASGAAITLLNKTKLKLVVRVIEDDPTTPRAQFVKKSGDILIK